MDQGLIPRRYAKALYEVGAERGTNAELYAIMQRVADAFAAENALQEAVANPFVADGDKVKLLDAAAGDGTKPELYDDFLKLLSSNGRLDLMRDVANAYIDLYRRKNNIYKVVVQSAATLNVETRQRITDLIRKHIGNGTLECSFEVDPKLIGGFKIYLGNELLDASVATQLNQIRLDLIK